MKSLKRFGILFGLFCLINAFVFWAQPVWLWNGILPFLEQEILVSPGIDKVIAFFATIFAFVQAPSGFFFDQLEKFWQFGQIEALLIISGISSLFTEAAIQFFSFISTKRLGLKSRTL